MPRLTLPYVGHLLGVPKRCRDTRYYEVLDLVDVDVREAALGEAHVALEIYDLYDSPEGPPTRILSHAGKLYRGLEGDGRHLTASEYQSRLDRAFDRNEDEFEGGSPWGELPRTEVKPQSDYRTGRLIPRDHGEVAARQPASRPIRFVGDDRNACARAAAIAYHDGLIEFDGKLWTSADLETLPRWESGGYWYYRFGVTFGPDYPASYDGFSVERYADAVAFANEFGPDRKSGLFLPVGHRVRVHDEEAVRRDDFLAIARNMLHAVNFLPDEAPALERWPAEAISTATRLRELHEQRRDLDANGAALAIMDTCALRPMLHREMGTEARRFLDFSRGPVRRWTKFEHAMRDSKAGLFERVRLERLADDEALAELAA